MASTSWFLVLIGLFASVVLGAVLPAYGLLFGEVIGVREETVVKKVWFS
jgi:hypothetical protein